MNTFIIFSTYGTVERDLANQSGRIVPSLWARSSIERATPQTQSLILDYQTFLTVTE